MQRRGGVIHKRTRSWLRSQSLAVEVAVAFACPEHVFATAFFINQQSVRCLGRVDAGNTVAADELGTVFFNPAGLTKVVQDGKDPDCIRVGLSGHLIVPRGSQRNRGSVAATQAIWLPRASTASNT